MEIHIATIVEGHGEEEAVPVLLRRIASDQMPEAVLRLPRPIRVPRSRLVKPGELERAVELAARRVGGRGGVLVVFDADDDAPCHLGPDILRRARAKRADLPISVVLAKQEFESWFLAAARSLRGRRGLADAIEPPDDPESVRSPKGLLSRWMTPPRTYSETLDQPALASVFDLAAARRADSFDKLWRDVGGLLREVARRAAESRDEG